LNDIPELGGQKRRRKKEEKVGKIRALLRGGQVIKNVTGIGNTAAQLKDRPARSSVVH